MSLSDAGTSTHGSVDTRRDDGVLVVALAGAYTPDMERWLGRRLRQCVEFTDGAFVLDVTRLGGCTRGGAEILAGFVHVAVRRGVAVGVVGLSRLQTRLWLATGRPIPTQYPSVGGAVVALAPRSGAFALYRAGQPTSVRDLEQEVLKLRLALLHRATIEQAKGVLMERLRCSDADAFAVLADRSQRSNRKLVAIARDVIAGDPG